MSGTRLSLVLCAIAAALAALWIAVDPGAGSPLDRTVDAVERGGPAARSTPRAADRHVDYARGPQLPRSS